MKTLGLIGGMSWESTLLYYQLINREVARHKGGLHSAPLLIYSFDFETIAALQAAGNWDEAGRRLAEAGLALKSAGAKALVICTNTMHMVAPMVEEATGLPLIHIADATGMALREAGCKTVGLLGTRFTMEKPFYRERLEQHFGLRVCIPDEAGRAQVHRIIYEELCKGMVLPASRQILGQEVEALKARGAEAVILGCTELGMSLSDVHCNGVPLFDTTRIHAIAAAQHQMDMTLLAGAV